MKDAIGFLGLGNMGSPMAERLVAAGYPLFFHDPRPEVVDGWTSKGATAVKDAAALADAASIVFLSLPTPDIVWDVVTGTAGLLKGRTVTLIVDLSTTGLDMSQRVGEAIASAGIDFVDAPISGGVAGAKAGTLAVMASGSADAVARATPLLEHLGRVFVLGSAPGMGQIAKVLNNLLSAGAMAISAEAASMGVRAGLDAKALIDVFNAGSGRNSATLDKYPKAVLPGTFNLGFAAGLMLKDVNLALAQADALGLAMPASRAVLAEWERAVERFGADADFSRMMQLAEQDMGVHVRLAEAAPPQTA